MPFQLHVVRGRSTVNRHRLASDGVTVAGRQEGCQLQIKSSQVSRRHCEFFERDGALIVKDLDSSNGTFVNGERIRGERVLKSGDELTIGGVKFRVESLHGAAAASPADTAVPIVAAPGSSSDAEAATFDDSIPLDEDAKTSVGPSGAPETAPTPAAAAEEPESVEDQEGAEIGEDAVAEFLMDLDVDDDDKR